MKLSILTLSYPGRIRKFLSPLMDSLQSQIERPGEVEVLGLCDNLSVSVGQKHNILNSAARGRFIAVVDDDDVVSDDYVSSLLAAIDESPDADCIVFDTDMYRDGEFVADVRWGIEYEFRDDFNAKKLWRPPFQLMAIRSDIKKMCPYPDRWRGSDFRQARAMRPLLQKQHRIDKTLYHYMSRSENKEHFRRQYDMERSATPPKLSILTLSYPTRIERFLSVLMDQLDSQIADPGEVEVLGLCDNLTMSVGAKWNVLVNAARGRFITAIGDDDLVSKDYVSSLVGAIDEHPDVDCIVFDTDMHRDGNFVATVHWGLEYELRNDLANQLMWRYPGELMAIRSDIRKMCPYADVWRGSDWRHSKKIRPLLQSQHRIDKVLYHYLHRSDNTTHVIKQWEDDRIKQEQYRALQVPSV